MPFRWIEPGLKGRQGHFCASREAAMASAVAVALRKGASATHAITPEHVPALWRSLASNGWRIEEKDA